jgi:dienelactone hydrolase
VAVLARYPVPDDGGRPLPVIVFCHGLGGSHRSYAALGAHLASHGYAVLHPQFLDSFPVASAALGLTGVDERTWTQDKRARDAMLTLLFDREHWLSRVARVHGVIGSLAGQPHLPVPLRDGQVIVAGHSYGAFTAQLVLGTRLHDADVGTGRLSHPAVAGGILLSPQGSGDRGLTSRSWDAVTRPLLVVTATHDSGPHGEGLAWRREPFDAAPSRLKHLAVVRRGNHLLGGVSLTACGDASPGEQHAAQTPVRDAVLAVSAAFADRVHGDLAAGGWLASGPFPGILAHAHRERAA